MLELNKIYHGDCIDIMNDIDAESIDLILCDLPYGITGLKWDSCVPLDKLWEHYERIIKPNGNILLFGTEPFSSKLRTSNMKLYRYDIYWDKMLPTGHGTCKYKPMKQVETISVFSKSYFSTGTKSRMNYYPDWLLKDTYVVKKQRWNSFASYHTKGVTETITTKTGYPRDIVRFKKVPSDYILHPTQKPTELLDYLIKLYSKTSDIVLDNCCGSGSTCLSAIQNGRKFIGIEQDDHFYEVSCNRVKQYQQKLF